MLKFPDCHEVCPDCISGKHVMHVLNELADLSVEYETKVARNGREYKILVIKGYAESDIYLEDLMRIIKLEYDRMQEGYKRSDFIDLL